MPERLPLNKLTLFSKKNPHFLNPQPEQDLQEHLEHNHLQQNTTFYNLLLLVFIICCMVCSLAALRHKWRTENQEDSIDIWSFLTFAVVCLGLYGLKHCYNRFQLFAQDTEITENRLLNQRHTFRFNMN